MAKTLDGPECIINISGSYYLLPQDRATEVFKLLHGATKVDTTYKDGASGWRYSRYPGSVELQHAPADMRAKLILEE